MRKEFYVSQYVEKEESRFIIREMKPAKVHFPVGAGGHPKKHRQNSNVSVSSRTPGNMRSNTSSIPGGGFRSQHKEVHFLENLQPQLIPSKNKSGLNMT
jgi:hypothetical protein